VLHYWLPADVAGAVAQVDRSIEASLHELVVARRRTRRARRRDLERERATRRCEAVQPASVTVSATEAATVVVPPEAWPAVVRSEPPPLTPAGAAVAWWMKKLFG
jgi:hypothetical protein